MKNVTGITGFQANSNNVNIFVLNTTGFGPENLKTILMTTNFRAINFLCVVTLRSCNNIATTDSARLKAASQELFKDG